MIKKCPLCEKEFETKTQRKYCPECIPLKWSDKGYMSLLRSKMKQKAVDLRGGKCEICGYDKCIAALEFHHIDPSQKEFRLGDGYGRTLEDFLKETDKCMLICADCHAELHYKERLKDTQCE